MTYAEYPPSARLAAVVERYWFLEGLGHDAPEPIFPDGRVEIILHFGDPFERHHPNGTIERQASALIVGQMREPIRIGPRGRAGVAGIRVRPSAVRAFAGCRADDMTGSIMDLEALCGSTSILRERLAAAPHQRSRVALLDEWIAALVVDVPAMDVDAAVEAISASGGSAALVSIASHAGISLRQLERKFLADVGLTPKMFARLVRLQQALRRIADGAPFADVAVACGYYDQAHMARDFGQLADTSPAAWRHHAGGLTPLFVSR